MTWFLFDFPVKTRQEREYVHYALFSKTNSCRTSDKIIFPQKLTERNKLQHDFKHSEMENCFCAV